MCPDTYEQELWVLLLKFVVSTQCQNNVSWLLATCTLAKYEVSRLCFCLQTGRQCDLNFNNNSIPFYGDSEKSLTSRKKKLWQLKYAIRSGWHVLAVVSGVELPWPLWVKQSHNFFSILISTYSKNILHKIKHKFAPFYCTALIFS